MKKAIMTAALLCMTAGALADTTQAQPQSAQPAQAQAQAQTQAQAQPAAAQDAHHHHATVKKVSAHKKHHNAH